MALARGEDEGAGAISDVKVIATKTSWFVGVEEHLGAVGGEHRGPIGVGSNSKLMRTQASIPEVTVVDTSTGSPRSVQRGNPPSSVLINLTPLRFSLAAATAALENSFGHEQ